MRKLLVIPFLILATFIFQSSTGLKKSGTCKPQISIMKGNVLWVGLDNPVEVPGFSADDYTMTLEPADVGKVFTTSYGLAVHISKPHKGYLKLTAKRKSNGSVLSELSCLVREISDPELSLNYHTGPFISQEELGKVLSVTSSIINSPFEGLRFKIVSYQYDFISGNVRKASGTSQSKVIDRNLKASLVRAKPGDMVVIFNVKAELMNVSVAPRTLANALVIRVK